MEDLIMLEENLIMVEDMDILTQPIMLIQHALNAEVNIYLQDGLHGVITIMQAAQIIMRKQGSMHLGILAKDYMDAEAVIEAQPQILEMDVDRLQQQQVA